MLGMTDVHDLPLRTAVDHYLVALRVEGAAPTTIETYRSVLASYLRWATTAAAPTLADFTLLQVRVPLHQPSEILAPVGEVGADGRDVRVQAAIGPPGIIAVGVGPVLQAASDVPHVNQVPAQLSRVPVILPWAPTEVLRPLQDCVQVELLVDGESSRDDLHSFRWRRSRPSSFLALSRPQVAPKSLPSRRQASRLHRPHLPRPGGATSPSSLNSSSARRTCRSLTEEPSRERMSRSVRPASAWSSKVRIKSRRSAGDVPALPRPQGHLPVDRPALVLRAPGHARISRVAPHARLGAVEELRHLRDIRPTFAAVVARLCPSPVAASTPMCAFIPKYHWFPFFT